MKSYVHCRRHTLVYRIRQSESIFELTFYSVIHFRRWRVVLLFGIKDLFKSSTHARFEMVRYELYRYTIIRHLIYAYIAIGHECEFESIQF